MGTFGAIKEAPIKCYMRSENRESSSFWVVLECFLEEGAFGKAPKGYLVYGHGNLEQWLWSKSVNKREVVRRDLNDSFWLEPRVPKGD